MERDFIQDETERYEKMKEEILEKNQDNLAKEINDKYNKLVAEFYGSVLTEEEREQKINNDFNDCCIKSLQNKDKTKKQEISGRTYPVKEIVLSKKQRWIIYAVLFLTGLTLHRLTWDITLLDAYRTIRNDQTSDFTKDEKEMLDPINFMDVPKIRETIKDYDGPYEYTKIGDRTDGTHNKYYVYLFDKNKNDLVQVTDRQLDPIEELVKEERKEIKGEEIPELKPKAAGEIGIQDGYGEQVGSSKIK